MRSRSTRRLVVFVVSLGVVGWLFVWLVGKKGDIQLGSDTSGMIAVRLLTKDGSQVVTIDSSGNVTKSAGYTAGRTDRDLAWSPDGNRLFFISDRKEDSFHIFRWDPQRNAAPEQRSIDKAGRSNLIFNETPGTDAELAGLVTVRGTVQEFFPVNGKSSQILPPSVKRVEAEDGGGAGSTLELLYKRFGQSFRTARYLNGGRFIAAVMQQEERGESLIVQDFEPDKDGKMKPPLMYFAAERIEIEVDKRTGTLLANIIEVFPQEGKDGKKMGFPFVHGIFMIDPLKSGAEGLVPVIQIPERSYCISDFAISPERSLVLTVKAKYVGDGNSIPEDLRAYDPNKSEPPLILLEGKISSPVFSPDGKKIAFIKREGPNHAVFIADSNGSNARNLTGTSGNYSRPLFSPQYK
jgi:dipeptidyl aminopeptidase/acylaminoacyl peptidase